MANTDVRSHSTASRRSDARQAHLLLAVVYPFCLAGAALSRVTRRKAAQRPRRSIFAEAHASAAACIPFAFR